MSAVRPTDATTPCKKCGAAMVVVRAWPLHDGANDVEVHLFKCEICSASEFYKFKFTAVPNK